MILPTHLTSNQGSGTSVVTASIAPISNDLILIWVRSVVAAGTDNTPTASGCGLTWTVAATLTDGAQTRITCFRALGVASAGAVTIDWAGQTQIEVIYSICDINGVDDSGGSNGSAAVVQAVPAFIPFGSTTALVTLASFSAPTNATFGGFIQPSAGTLVPGSGFTTIDSFVGGQGVAITEWRGDPDTSVDATSTSTNSWMAVALEIRALVAPPPPALIGSATPPLVWATRIRP